LISSITRRLASSSVGKSASTLIVLIVIMQFLLSVLFCKSSETSFLFAVAHLPPNFSE